MIDGWETIRYPDAELVPWQYQRQDGTAGFYIAANTPIAVVLHTMQGYIGTARTWATTGTGRIASWHFSVGRDGSVLQHLNLRDGGFHAGVTDRQASTTPPSWPLWKGRGINVNHYTIGIEHEGFSGEPFTEPQAAASRKLCQWLAEVLEIPLDREHFPPHADIDTVNRVNDFNTPELRELHYQYLFGEADMTKEETQALIDAVVAPLQATVGALREEVIAARAETAALNTGVMERMNLFKIAAGPYAGVQDATQKLEA